jgi:cyclopropane fatty-acyl-phospholipid synthase-like methyltransferase
MPKYEHYIEDPSAVRHFYDETLAGNLKVHDLIYRHVFGPDQYIGQYSDNSRDELTVMGSSLDIPRGANVLDIGSGRGCVAVYFAKIFGWSITGVDITRRATEEARRHRAPAGASLTFIEGDLYTVDLDRTFDGAYAVGAFCHFDANHLFERLWWLLVPGGRLAFMERVLERRISRSEWHNLTALWHCPAVYSETEYRAALDASGFRITKVIDLTASFRVWQRRSVEVRERLAETIIARTSREYHTAAFASARYENDVTQRGGLGYRLFLGEKSS